MCVYMYVCIHIYIYIYIISYRGERFRFRTDGVNTNGAAAKVMNLTDWGKRYALALLGRQK